MAKYSFDVSGSQLIVSLIPVLDDVQPTSMSYLAPSFKIGVGKINAYEYGQPRQSFLFTEIGEIDGVAPTDLQDAFDKLTTATANFNGGGTAPYKVYTALLSQSGTDAPIATVLENTLGYEPVFVYNDIGGYSINLQNALFEKTYIPTLNIHRPGNSDLYQIVEDLNLVTLNIVDSNGTDSDGLLNDSPIEIRVYN